MSHLLALDQGTSSSKAIIFNLTGRVVGVGQHEFDNIFPADGWVEQDPEVLWRTTLLAGREALASAGLKGEDIPLMARILCIADSYDSMTANRPYRSARGREYAVEEFRSCSGSQFDPKLVEAFLRVVDRGEA